jgi:hypothetical protein
VGAREGFAILRFLRPGFELRTPPLTDFEKVVVFRSKPEQVEIWSALSDHVASDSDPMNYVTRSCPCRLKSDIGAGHRSKDTGAAFLRTSIIPGIEIRP